MNNEQKFEKLEHTLCLNVNNIKFALDEFNEGPNGGPIDCKDIHEMLDYLDDLVPATQYLDLLDRAMPEMMRFYYFFISPKGAVGYDYYRTHWNMFTRCLLNEDEFKTLKNGIRYSYQLYENEPIKIQNEN